MKANLDKNLAPAWVSGKSYSTGEFCLYNKRLYICTTDNSDAEFDNSKWERRNLVDLVSGINSNLSERILLVDKWYPSYASTITVDIPSKIDNGILLVFCDQYVVYGEIVNVNKYSVSEGNIELINSHSYQTGSVCPQIAIFKLTNMPSNSTLTISGLNNSRGERALGLQIII